MEFTLVVPIYHLWTPHQEHRAEDIVPSLKSIWSNYGSNNKPSIHVSKKKLKYKHVNGNKSIYKVRVET